MEEKHKAEFTWASV